MTVWDEAIEEQAKKSGVKAARSLAVSYDDQDYHAKETVKLAKKVFSELCECVNALSDALKDAQSETCAEKVCHALDQTVGSYIDGRGELSFNTSELCAMANHYRDDCRFLASVKAGELVYDGKADEWIEPK